MTDREIDAAIRYLDFEPETKSQSDYGDVILMCLLLLPYVGGIVVIAVVALVQAICKHWS